MDISDLIHCYPAAKPLCDTAEFAKFYLDEWPTIAWPNGFDVSPETLYERATHKTVEYLSPQSLAAA